MKKENIKIQGCAIGDLPLGHYLSLRNEAFVLHSTKEGNLLEYPYNSDSWNAAC